MTPEPSGRSKRSPATGSSVQRHRASSLHYDFRLEVDGVLVSWAVPKGPTPRPRRPSAWPIHVEDHPLDYFDFEGVIPKGEYGGGDVIVGLGHVGGRRRHRTRLRAIARRRPPLRAAGREARRAVRARARGQAGRQGAVAAPAQARRARRGRLGPRGAPCVGEERPHQRRGPGRPVGARGPATSSSGGTRPTTSSPRLDALGKAGSGRSAGTTLRLTNLDKVLFPAKRGRAKALTKRDLDPPPRRDGPGDAALPGRPAGQPATASRRHRRRGLLAQGRCPKHARVADPLALRRRTARARPSGTWSSTPPALGGLGGQLRRRRAAPVDLDRPAPARADVGDDRHRSRDEGHVRRRPRRWPASTAPRLEHLDVAGLPEGHRQARHPDLGAPSPPATRSRTPRTGSRRLSRAVGGTVPELVELGVADAEAQRSLPPRLHAERHQQDARRAVQRPAAAGAPVSVPITWDELDDPELAAGPLDHPDRRRAPRRGRRPARSAGGARSNASRRSNRIV